MEFKGTKGKWKVVEHSWSDTSIMCGEKTICTQSIYDDATEENQEELESEVSANFKLMSLSKDLLAALHNCLNTMKALGANDDWIEVIEAERIIKESTTI